MKHLKVLDSKSFLGKKFWWNYHASVPCKDKPKKKWYEKPNKNWHNRISKKKTKYYRYTNMIKIGLKLFSQQIHQYSNPKI